MQGEPPGPMHTDEADGHDRALRDLMMRQLIGFRRYQGLSVPVVATRMGMSEFAVEQIERQTNWQLGTLQKYARAVGCVVKLQVKRKGPRQ